MSINISNDYPSFKITDNLHQLVNRLGILTDAVDSNFRVIDSSMNDVLAVVHRDSALITADNDLTIRADNLTLQVDSDLTSSCDRWYLNTERGATINSTNAVVLNSGTTPTPFSYDLSNVCLQDRLSIYGGLENNNGDLLIRTGTKEAVRFSDGDAEFPGTITMPTTGSGSPYTEAKTISGAINELHEELIQITDVELERIVVLEGTTADHTTTLNQHTDTLNSHDLRIQDIEGLLISIRLNSIESRLDDIETRLGLLGV
jgi:hypothetical protein